MVLAPATLDAQKYVASNGRLRMALAKQPFSPTGLSNGPKTMAEGGIQKVLVDLGVDLRARLGDRLRDDPAHRRRRPVSGGGQPDDRRRCARRARAGERESVKQGWARPIVSGVDQRAHL
jgi:hypothetical protein